MKKSIFAIAAVVATGNMAFLPQNTFAQEYEQYCQNRVVDRNIRTTRINELISLVARQTDEEIKNTLIEYQNFQLQNQCTEEEMTKVIEGAHRIINQINESRRTEDFRIIVKVNGIEVQNSEFNAIRYSDFLNHLTAATEAKLSEGLYIQKETNFDGNTVTLNFENIPPVSGEEFIESEFTSGEEIVEDNTTIDSEFVETDYTSGREIVEESTVIEENKSQTPTPIQKTTLTISAPNTGFESKDLNLQITGLLAILASATFIFIRKIKI
ncbi:MAG: LPXTG cell wall anchor domain-containing protein [bacterium]|nr:LPXTG cell wall anchor domain-containing protein [bacterium]